MRRRGGQGCIPPHPCPSRDGWVRAEVWHQPAEILERPDGPPLTADDLLDFHFLLNEDGWFDRLAEYRHDGAT